MTEVLLVGDSHIGPIRRAFNETPERYPWLTFARLGKGGIARTDFFEVDEPASAVRISAPEWNTVVFSRDGGRWPDLVVLSLPINSSRILRGFSWDTQVPWQLKQGDDESTLSDALVDGLIDQDSGYATAYAIALAELGLPVAVIEAPRFFEDAPYLNKCRFDVIHHIDTRYRQRVTERLANNGVDVITQPVETIDVRGTTKMDFDNEREGDIHHANAAYGQIVLEQIRLYGATKLGVELGSE